MRSIQELKAEIEVLQRQLDEARERDREEAVERVRELCKDFDITPSMLKGYLVDGRKGPRGHRKQKDVQVHAQDQGADLPPSAGEDSA